MWGEVRGGVVMMEWRDSHLASWRGTEFFM